jgi:hypothetical protein
MAKAFTGKDGKLLIGTTEAGKVVDWSIEGQNEILETTTLNDGYRSFITGLIGFSGSASLLYYKPDSGDNSASVLLREARAGNEVTLVLRLVDGTTNKDIKVKALIGSFSIGASVGEIVRASFSFTVTGDLQEMTI